MGWFNGEWYDDGAGSAVYVRDWCPDCAPDGVPEPWVLRTCVEHTPEVTGSADVQARGENGAYWSSGHSEAGGSSNVEWCRIIHGTQH
jgi:hypothetical protein